MKYIIIALLISSNAYADEAIWTGKFELSAEKEYSNTWDCEYIYQGEKFWRLQETYCKETIEAKYQKE